MSLNSRNLPMRVAAFLKDHCQHGEIDEALFAVAGPVQGYRCVLTNCSWVVDTREFNETFRVQARIVNDFEAVAYSLPWLASADVAGIGGGRAELAAPMAVLGPGTGLGRGVSSTRNWKTFCHFQRGRTCDACEAPTIGKMKLSNDCAIGSGTYQRNAYFPVEAWRTSIRRSSSSTGSLSSPEARANITKRALDGDCRVARDALTTFCAFLGSFAGNVALSFGARGGVYIAGGISPRIVRFFSVSRNSVIALRPKAGCEPISKPSRPT